MGLPSHRADGLTSDNLLLGVFVQILAVSVFARVKLAQASLAARVDDKDAIQHYDPEQRQPQTHTDTPLENVEKAKI